MRVAINGAGVAALPRWPALRLNRHCVAAVAIIASLATGIAADRWMRLATIASIPAPAALTSSLFNAPVPVTVTVTARGMQAPWDATDDDVRRSVQLWRRMHLEDWNRLPSAMREQGLDNMLQHYAGILNDPAAWDHMTVYDWDDVPQPVRTVVYRRMVAYWSGFYRVGADFDLPAGAVAETLAAIVMSESWFDHRARSRNRDGTWDVGLAQASSYARARLRQMRADGLIDAAVGDEDQYNPWLATRFVAVWMQLMLLESGGDLERAVRAYNRGSRDAMDRLGAAYLAAVKGRRALFIRNVGAPPAWDYVWRRSRLIIAAHSAERLRH